jgi:Flp pilus assembly secretin CpaC
MNVQFATGAPRLLSPARASAIAVAVAVTVGQVHAQNLQPVARNSDSGAANTAANASDTDTSEVQLLVGRSTLLNVGNNITRVSLTSPNVADAMVTTPSQLLIHGKAPARSRCSYGTRRAASSASRSWCAATSVSWASS